MATRQPCTAATSGFDPRPLLHTAVTKITFDVKLAFSHRHSEPVKPCEDEGDRRTEWEYRTAEKLAEAHVSLRRA